MLTDDIGTQPFLGPPLKSNKYMIINVIFIVLFV